MQTINPQLWFTDIMFQEFQLSVTPLDSNRYLVRTEKVAPGVPLAEEQVHWSVEDWLEQARSLMNDPLSRLLQGGEALPEDPPLFLPGQLPNRPSTTNLISLGQQLYDALFQGSLRDSWIMAQGIAHNQRAVLRLRLGLKGTLLPRLPWEVLHTGGKESLNACYRPLATGTDIAFSRYQINAPLGSPTLPIAKVKDRPLKILMAIAGPNDLDSLELQQEAQALKAELDKEIEGRDPVIDLTILSHPGREELTQALEQGQYQVFHYAGHSNLGDSGGNVSLVHPTTGLTEQLLGEDLAGLLANNGIQLAVFNSCRGADTVLGESSGNPSESTLAQALVKCGIPAVLAMAEQIPDEVALTLTRLFYRNLNQGYPIDSSLSRSRQGLISAYGSNQLYWALPVLYLHSQFDGILMDWAEGSDVTEELLELSETDEIPLEVLSGDFRGLDWETEGEESEFPAFEQNGTLSREDDDFLGEFEEGDDSPNEFADDDESFIRDIMQDLSEPETPETVSPPEVVAPPRNPPAASTPQKRSLLPLALILGAISLGAIALLGWWFFRVRPNPSVSPTPEIQQPLSVTPTSPEDIDLTDVKQIGTDKLLSLAIERFNQGEFDQGAIAVTELLDRNVLTRAQAALETVPATQADNAQILFLKGRLAWQTLLQDTQDPNSDLYTIGDVQNYWKSAADADPNSILYRNALGFAYYQEGKYNLANEAWADALELNQEQTNNPEIFNTYAGIALVVKKWSQDPSIRGYQTLGTKAIKLRELVMTENPINFQPDALANNWLWSPQAIKDWQALISTNGKK
nr:CHAT domain-containing protein [Lusitaniella coriacea]